MLQSYLSIFIFICVGLLFGLLIVGLGWMLSVRKPDPEKNSPYECGFEPFEDARLPFDVRFYLVAILFIIFDLETAFFFPWAVSLRHIVWPGLISMGIFLLILTIGFIYEWKKGALEWE